VDRVTASAFALDAIAASRPAKDTRATGRIGPRHAWTVGGRLLSRLSCWNNTCSRDTGKTCRSTSYAGAKIA
jgi:hypothetical protein